MRVSGCSWTPCCRGWKESLGFVYFPSDCRGKTFWFPLRPWPNWIIVKWTLSNFMFHNLWCAAQRREVQETHHQAERHGEPNLLNAERVTENSCEWVSRGHAPTYTDNIYTLRSALCQLCIHTRVGSDPNVRPRRTPSILTHFLFIRAISIRCWSIKQRDASD